MPVEEVQLTRRSSIAQDLSRRKSTLLNRVVPIALIPAATTTTLLLMSSKGELPLGDDCSYPLPLFLLLTACISAGLIVQGVVSRRILDWACQDGYLGGAGESSSLVAGLEHLARALATMQVAALAAITLLLLYMAPHVQTVDAEADYYCEHGVLVFSVALMTVYWAFFGLALAAYCYVALVARKEARQEMEKRRREQEEDKV